MYDLDLVVEVAQFSYRIVPGQAFKQFTSTSCLHFRKELIIFVRYSANNRRKFSLSITTKVTCAVKELNPDRPIQSNALPIELTGRR
jgi:hypothetical protein